MPGVTKEQIQAAREADLFTYLQFHEPGVLKQDGPNFRHKEHDSLVYVTGKRYWYWNSRGRSINALDYLIQIRGYGLVDAVHALVGGEIPQEPAYRSTAEIQVSKEPEKKTFALPWARRCATAAVFYLQKRGISSEVIRQCLQAGIFYEARYHGEPVCVFVGKDDSGKAKFACMRSISGNLKRMSMAATKDITFVIPRKVRAAGMWQSLKLLLMRFPCDTSRAGGMEMEWLSLVFGRYFPCGADFFPGTPPGDTACYPLYGPRPCRICQCPENQDHASRG